MTTGQIVVITLRLVVPLMILKKPLAGGIVAMILDGLDVVIVEWFGPGGMGEHYQGIDKVLDLWYLGLEAWVAWTWTERLPRITAVSLFAWRVAGVILFELFALRSLLFVFPNVFEHWFLFVLVRNKWFRNIQLSTWKQVAFWLVILTVPKLGQEYLLHIAETQPWDWIKTTLGL